MRHRPNFLMCAAIGALLVSAASPPFPAGAGSGPTVGGCDGPLQRLPGPDLGTFSYPAAIAATGAGNVWLAEIGRDGAGSSSLVAAHGDDSGFAVVPTPSGSVGVGIDVATTGSSDAWLGAVQPTSEGQAVVLHSDGGPAAATAFPTFAAEVDSDTGIHLAGLSPTDVWAVGDLLGAVQHSFIAHWNGTAWSLVPHPDQTYLSDVTAVAPDDVYAAGQHVLHWDGTAWSQLPTPAGTFPQVITGRGPDDVWLLSIIGFTAATRLDHWNGTSWTQVLPPSGVALEQISEAPGGVLWATAQASTALDPLIGGGFSAIARYDGTWRVAPTDVTSPGVAALGGAAARFASAIARPSGVGWDSFVSRLCALTFTSAGVAPAAGTNLPFPGAGGFAGTGSHSAVARRAQDTLGLFDTGPMAPGAVKSFSYPVAGGYRVRDPVSGASAPVTVPLLQVPGFHNVRVIYAGAAVPTGYAPQLQARRPGASAFTGVRLKPGALFVRFSAKTGPLGTYAVRARLHNLATGAVSGWSPVLTFTIR